MITDNYIRMCDKAKQLQRAWKPKDWDRFVYRDSEEMDIMMYLEKEYNRKEMIIINGVYIWLPTQEQLQEIVKDILFLIQGSFIDLYMSASTGHRDSHIICRKAKSMNELWLMCVMYEKYHKIWTGEKWVKGVIK